MDDQPRDNSRVLLVIDIEHISDHDAYRLCRSRIHDTVNALRSAGYTTHAVRIDINGYPHLNP